MATGYVSEIFASFQGEGLYAGRRHAFLRMAGCNLRCRYCDTPESLERTTACTVHGLDGSEHVVANPLDVADTASLLAPFLQAPGLHALAITGGEPLVQSKFLAELLGRVRPAVPVLLETNGTYPERIDAVLPFVDIVSMDVKLPSNSGEPPFWADHAGFLARCGGKTVYVKVPVDDSTRQQEVREAAILVARAGQAVVFFLQPILSTRGELRISPSSLERFYEVACEHLEDVRVMPQTHKFLGVR
jgi:7-carboxy-7-deazaguanine synthase